MQIFNKEAIRVCVGGEGESYILLLSCQEIHPGDMVEQNLL